MGHWVSAAATQLCHCSTKVATDNALIDWSVCSPVKFYLLKQALARFGHWVYSLLVLDWNSSFGHLKVFIFSGIHSLHLLFSKSLIEPKRKREASSSHIFQPQSYTSCLPASDLLFWFKFEAGITVIWDFPVRTFSVAAWLPWVPLSFFGTVTLKVSGVTATQSQAKRATLHFHRATSWHSRLAILPATFSSIHTICEPRAAWGNFSRSEVSYYTWPRWRFSLMALVVFPTFLC